MKKYSVRLYFHTHVDVEVEADNEQDAREEAYCLAGTDEFNSQYMTNSQVDNDPDVEEIDEFEDERLTPQQRKELGYGKE
jgi:hypothetical protein